MIAFAIVLLLLDPPAMVLSQPEAELVVEEVRAELTEEGKVKLFLKAHRVSDGLQFANVISVPIKEDAFGKELRVADFRNVELDPNGPPPDPAALYLVYESFDAAAAFKGKLVGGWFPKRMERTTIKVLLGGPVLAVQSNVKFVLARPDEKKAPVLCVVDRAQTSQ